MASKKLITNTIIIFILVHLISSTTEALYNFTIAKQNCRDRCGDIQIPYPFGAGDGCYDGRSFLTTCNETAGPNGSTTAKLFLQNTSIEITDISLDGQLTLLQYTSHECYSRNRTRISDNAPFIELPISLTVNYTANKFTIVGCDTYGFVTGIRLDRDYQTGCTAMCYREDDLIEGSCTGLGCCQTSIPKDVWRVEVSLHTYDNYSRVWDFDKCGYAFVVQESAFNFSAANLTNLRSVGKLPMVSDWAMGNGTCEEAKTNSTSYACRSEYSECYKPGNGYGYRCSCLKGYEGNPYLIDGCKDINECERNLHNCGKNEYCKDEDGSFSCKCRNGYHGDRSKGGSGCYRDESIVFKLVAGIAVGIVMLMLAACLSHTVLKRRRLAQKRQKFFRRNGGTLLQEQLDRGDKTPGNMKIFTETELQKATNNFHKSMIIGQGGFGTVYKGTLPDSNNQFVAIKKSKQVEPKQAKQFVNEVMILSQINHRNVIKFLGCCVETPVPLLVYEFVENGTLFEHIHDRERSRLLTWEVRLRIAAEAANVLSYLHSSASTPIIHRDVKSANILLDHSFAAKVSDFGASKLVPLDQMQLTTMVQGTWGYLDPEYMQTGQLTEKSDVYSFGVLLVELLTGMKALSFEREDMEQNLAYFFLSKMKRDHLFQVLDDSIVVEEGNEEQIRRVASLARSCICVRGEDRPSMKDVAMELEGMRRRDERSTKRSWDPRRGCCSKDENEMESLLGFVGCNDNNDGSSTATFDGVKSYYTDTTMIIEGNCSNVDVVFSSSSIDMCLYRSVGDVGVCSNV